MNISAESPSQQLAQLLRSEQQGEGLDRVFPEGVAVASILDALAMENVAASRQQRESGRRIHDHLRQTLAQLDEFQQLSRCPILAITGLLNAGKSSLLATYLSPENRGRVLRGLDNQSGTNRFVIWLPTVYWNEPKLFNTLVAYMSQLFGHPPEQLSEDPSLAALQYNGRILTESLMHPATGQPSEPDQQIDPMHVPLIASDPGLDKMQLGLIDCPDIQTGFLSQAPHQMRGSDLAESRRQQLHRVGRLCSAFLAVSKMNNLHDEGLTSVLASLRDVMPGVPRMLAINKVKSRYAPEVVYEQARGLVERFGLSRVYVAYDYRSSQAESRIPPAPPKMHADAKPQPIFFELQGEGAVTRGTAADYHYLFDLGEQLAPGSLAEASSRSLRSQLKAHTAEALQWFSTNADAQQRQLTDIWQAVTRACHAFMAQRDPEGNMHGLRLQASPAILAQMADSLQRTAPLWMRLSLKIDRTARQFQQAIADSASRIKILGSASQSVSQFTRKFRRGEGAEVVTPERFAESIRSYDVHDALALVSQEELVDACGAAMRRFAEEDTTRLDPQRLDAWSRQVWGDMSLKQKLRQGTQPLAILMAPLLAAVLVPIDAGGTAVLVFASAKELLAAAGIAAVMAPITTGGGAMSIVQREEPWRQLSDLFALFCDSLGAPRPTRETLPEADHAGRPRALLPSELPVKGASIPPVIERWELPESAKRQLELTLQRLP